MSIRIFALAILLALAGCAGEGVNLSQLSSLASGAGSSSSGINAGTLVQTAQKVQQASTEINEEQEIALGRGIASNLLGAQHSGLHPDKQLQQYVNRVGRWLASQSERPDLPWHFVVLDNEGLNAFAAPGGYVFVTSGLLAQMSSEAELAGVLGHEISHVLKKHHLQAIQKNAWASIGVDLGGQVLSSKTGVPPALAGAMTNVVKNLYASGLDQADEYEADRMGVVLAARAGYDPYGLPAVLQMMESFDPDAPLVALMFATHPPLAQRLEQLNRRMSPALDRFSRQQTLAPRYIRYLARH